MHPILELMMEYKLTHCQITVKPRGRPPGPAGPKKPARPPRGPRKPRVVNLSKPLKRVPHRDRPKTRQIQKNLMKIAQRAEAYKNSLRSINENTEINESR